MGFLVLLAFAILGGILYRMGGAAGYNTKFRDFGVPTVFLAVMAIKGFYEPWYWLVLTFGLFFYTLTTYWDWMFGFDNMGFSGFMNGISAFPMCFIAGHWGGWGIRAALLGIAFYLLNEYLPEKVWLWTRDIVEEFSRGFLLIVTIPLMLIL